MNRGNRRAGEHRVLEPCALCGMYSGERMEDAAPPFDFAVVCASCGARTRPYHGLTRARTAFLSGFGRWAVPTAGASILTNWTRRGRKNDGCS